MVDTIEEAMAVLSTDVGYQWSRGVGEPKQEAAECTCRDLTSLGGSIEPAGRQASTHTYNKKVPIASEEGEKGLMGYKNPGHYS